MIIIGSDHSGIELRKNIEKYLEKINFSYIDINGSENQEGDDYPDIAVRICNKVLENENNIGIAICGTGIGISVACNKVKGIIAANCTDEYMAEMARRHNNANVLCLGARLKFAKNSQEVECIVNNFINSFYEKGRHERRLLKIKEIEERTIEGDIKDGSNI